MSFRLCLFFSIQYHQQNDLTFKRWQIIIPLIITQSGMGREALFRMQRMEQSERDREKEHPSKRTVKRSEQQQQLKQNNGGAHKNSDKL